MVISQFHPMIGGAERQAQLLAKRLIEQGLKVQMVTGWWKFGTPRRDKIDGIDVFRNFSFWGMFGIKGIRTLGGVTYMGTLALYLLLHRRDYDIIHVHQALYPAFVSVLVGGQILHKAVIVKTASSGMTSDIRQMKRFPSGSLQLTYLLKKMDCLVAVSKVSGKEFIDIGYPESRIFYIPNGVTVPFEEKARYGRVTRVVTTTRLSKEKGVDVLLKAWASVAKEDNTLQLQVLGDGPLKSDLKKLSHSLGVDGSVEFRGRVGRAEEYLKGADLFVLPSRTEGMSNALLEAMSYGVPCIATRVGGNDELLRGSGRVISKEGYLVADHGLLINPDDVQSLSEAILSLVRDQDLREEIGRKARIHVTQNFSVDAVAEKYVSLYQQMLGGRS
jgi:glycosyltransferase involved in cell wall biosynthesis